jgi:hypothetical protein
MDAYQQAVEYLTENPDKIAEAWMNPRGSMGGALFLYANISGKFDGTYCGCLTMIRQEGSNRIAATGRLTDAIKGDSRLPWVPNKITPDHLPIFAGWQRRIDQELGRTPPPLDPRLPAPKGDIEIPAIEYGMHGGVLCSDSTPDALGELVKEQTL